MNAQNFKRTNNGMSEEMGRGWWDGGRGRERDRGGNDDKMRRKKKEKLSCERI